MVAGCLHEQSRARLGEKRNIRQMCDCDNKRVIVSSGAKYDLRASNITED